MRRLILAAALLGVACQNPVDKAAKARIFSPEDPPKFVTRAADDLGPSHLNDSAEHIKRVFTMSALEAAERLGPHQVKSALEFRWSGAGSKSELDEVHTLTIGSHGDFAARLDAGDRLGDSKQGMEMIRAQGRVFARSRFQKFRERTRDRGAADRYEQEVYDVLGTLYELVDGRVALSPEGEDTVAGRKVYKYRVVLAEKTPALDDGPKLPPLATPKGGYDAHLKAEQLLSQKREPRTLSGTLSVDAQTAVPLAARLEGTVDAPGEGNDHASLHLLVDTSVPKVGADLVVAAPKDVAVDADRPQSIAAALERFDLPRAATRADGGADAEDDEDK
ncbi:MAG: hypothetical protein JST54_18010 [Deltaproteobacteria bacterium]|nr:hypothetical protein [Deltaproteobacteria bacterium]